MNSVTLPLPTRLQTDCTFTARPCRYRDISQLTYLLCRDNRIQRVISCDITYLSGISSLYYHQKQNVVHNTVICEWGYGTTHHHCVCIGPYKIRLRWGLTIRPHSQMSYLLITLYHVVKLVSTHLIYTEYLTYIIARIARLQ